MLDDRGIAQVSMNLTNFEKTPISRVFELVKREAERYGVTVLESEIVGLIPQAALLGRGRVLPAARRLHADQVLENTAPREAAESDAALAFQRLLFGALARRDAERPHLPVQVAALDAEHLRRARHVAVLRGQRAQDVVALEPIARLVQRQHGSTSAGVASPASRPVASEKRQIARR